MARIITDEPQADQIEARRRGPRFGYNLRVLFLFMNKNDSSLNERAQTHYSFWPQMAAWALSLVCALLAAYIICGTFSAVRAGALREPLLDQWSFLNRVRLWQSGQQSFWALLWRQHNEHRMVLNFIILFLDRVCFSADGTLALACAWLFQILHALLWSALYWRAEKSPASRLAYAALAAGAFFCAAQFENFLWPFQANFMAVFLLASLAIVCMLRHCQNKHPSYLAAATLLAAAATFCMANGVLLWLILLLMAAVEGAASWTFIAILAAGLAALGAYLSGYVTPAQHANPLISILHPELITGYLGVYFLSPFAHLPFWVTPVRAGLFCQVLIVAVFGIYLRLRAQGRAKAYAFYVHTSLFLFGTAVLTALGRVNLGWAQAESSRYGTTVFLFWLSLISAVCLFLSRRADKARKDFWSSLLAAAMLAEIFLPLQKVGAATAVDLGRNANISGLSLALDVFDPAAWRHLFPDPQMIRDNLPYLQAHHLSIFSDPLVQKLGSPLFASFKAAPNPTCSGAFLGFIPLPDASSSKRSGRVFGKGWLVSNDSAPVQNVLIADERRGIVGLADGFRPARDFFPSPDPLRGQWGGYARFVPSSRRLWAYGVLPDGKDVCLLGSMLLSK